MHPRMGLGVFFLGAAAGAVLTAQASSRGSFPAVCRASPSRSSG